MTNPPPPITHVVRVTVEVLDAAAVPTVEPVLAEAARDGRVVLDLRAVRFADSAGLGMLVRFRRHAELGAAMGRVGPQLELCMGRVPAGLLPLVVTLPDVPDMPVWLAPAVPAPAAVPALAPDAPTPRPALRLNGASVA